MLRPDPARWAARSDRFWDLVVSRRPGLPSAPKGTALRVEALEERVVPTRYAVSLDTPGVGSKFSSAATSSGPGLQQVKAGVFEAATEYDAVVQAISGTVVIDIIGTTLTHTFSAATASLTQSPGRPFWVTLARTCPSPRVTMR